MMLLMVEFMLYTCAAFFMVKVGVRPTADVSYCVSKITLRIHKHQCGQIKNQKQTF